MLHTMKQREERIELGESDESRREASEVPADRDDLDLSQVQADRVGQERGLRILPFLEARITDAALASVRRRMRQGRDRNGYSLAPTIYQTGQCAYEIRP